MFNDACYLLKVLKNKITGKTFIPLSFQVIDVYMELTTTHQPINPLMNWKIQFWKTTYLHNSLTLNN